MTTKDDTTTAASVPGDAAIAQAFRAIGERTGDAEESINDKPYEVGYDTGWNACLYAINQKARTLSAQPSGDCNCASGRGAEHCIVHADNSVIPQLDAPPIAQQGGGEVSLLRECLEFTEYAAAALIGSHPLSDEYKAEFLELGDPLQKKLIAALASKADGGES